MTASTRLFSRAGTFSAGGWTLSPSTGSTLIRRTGGNETTAATSASARPQAPAVSPPPRQAAFQSFTASPWIGFHGEQPPIMLDVQASDILWGIQMPLPLRGDVALKGKTSLRIAEPASRLCLPVQRG